MTCADPSAGPGQARSAAHMAGGSAPTSARGGQAQGTVWSLRSAAPVLYRYGWLVVSQQWWDHGRPLFRGTMLYRFRSFGATDRRCGALKLRSILKRFRSFGATAERDPPRVE